MANSVAIESSAEGQGAGRVMVVLEGEEVITVKRALELWKRTNGRGTVESRQCEHVLEKLATAKPVEPVNYPLEKGGADDLR